MALSCCKKMPALFKGITSNNNGDFYCLNIFTHLVQNISLKT